GLINLSSTLTSPNAALAGEATQQQRQSSFKIHGSGFADRSQSFLYLSGDRPRPDLEARLGVHFVPVTLCRYRGIDGLKNVFPFWTSRIALQTVSPEVCLIR